jgi:hypothetical protein
MLRFSWCVWNNLNLKFATTVLYRLMLMLAIVRSIGGGET